MMTKNKKKRVLLLTCGTNACFHIAKTLKEQFQDAFYIVGTDINKRWMIPTACYLDAYYTSPLSSSPEYYQFVLDICTKEKIDFLIPLYDADQLLFYEDNPDLLSRDITSFGINSKWIDIYKSKEDTNQFLKTHGFAVPQEFTVEQIELSQEYFVKPVHGNGSIGARKMIGSEILKTDTTGLVIQELCGEPEVTLECVNYDNKIYSVARERLASKAGVCSKARVYEDKELHRAIERLSEVIPLPFLFNIQFMKSLSGEWLITDVNLRAAGGMGLSYAAGWDAVSAMAKTMLDLDEVTSTLKVPERDVFVIRSNSDVVTKASKQRIAFDLDGTLLDSRQRHVEVLNEVLREEGVKLDTKGYMDFKAEGRSTKEWLIQKGVNEEESVVINNKWIARIEEDNFLAYDKLYDGIERMLSNLSETSSLYIVTARNRKENTLKQIKELGIYQYFEKVYVVESSKLTPTLKASILKGDGIDIYYGDTESDEKAAQIAGCLFKAVLNGFRSKNYWEKRSSIICKLNEEFLTPQQ